MINYEKSKNWNMFIEENKLFITKGADEIYFLDEITEEQAPVVYESYYNNSFAELINNNEYKDILIKLEQAGVIYTKIFDTTKKKLKLLIKYYGTPTKEFKNELDNLISKKKNIELVSNLNSSDLMLIIRVNETLKNIMADYSNISVPHIFIDLAYANTISIGPLVYKKETACLNCFIGTLAKNWGDPTPPIEPNIINKHELVTSFILERIEEYRTFGNCSDLINGVWNFNVNTFNSAHDKTYKSPWCPICNDSKDNPKIDLPWINEV